MKNPGEILLISCYELGHQPIALASPLGFLHQAGFDPRALDLSVENLDTVAVARARLIGISVPMHTALRVAVRVVEEIRRLHPQVHLCLYGLYAWMNSDFLLSHGVDSVIGGEFEKPLVELAQALESGRAPLHPAPPHLARLPFPPLRRQSLLPLRHYAKLVENGVHRLAGAVEASRGCRHLCRHCPIPPLYHGKFFVVPQEIILQDIRELVGLGATHITFADPDFLNGPRHSLEIVRAMHREFPHLTFDFTAKVEHILRHRVIFPELRELGCLFVVSAVESLNDEVLFQLKKDHTKEDVFQALQILRNAGIFLRASLVPFTPWESLESYSELLDWVEGEDLIDCIDSVHFSIRLLIPPGSLLLKEPGLRPYLQELVLENFSNRWSHPDPRMEKLQKDVYLEIQRGIEEKKDAREIFRSIRGLTDKATGKAVQPLASAPQNGPAPRLSENWFCCAEPAPQLLDIAPRYF